MRLLVFCYSGPWRFGGGEGMQGGKWPPIIAWCAATGGSKYIKMWKKRNNCLFWNMQLDALVSHKTKEAVIYITILPQAYCCDSSCSLSTPGSSGSLRKERCPKILCSKQFLGSAHRSRIWPKVNHQEALEKLNACIYVSFESFVCKYISCSALKFCWM